MFKRISLPVLVTLMCVMITVVLVLVSLNQQRIKNKVVQQSATTVTRTDYSGVARKTLDWIDQQRNNDGWYILEKGCDYETKTCNTVWDNPEGNQDGLIATWARFNYYLQTKNQKDLDIVKSDLNIFFNKYPNGVNNALWICKITYEMYSSNLFDQETKDKLERMCFDQKIITAEEFENYWSDRLTQVDKFLKMNNAWQTWDGYRLSTSSFDQVLAYSSDWLYRYLWKKDKNNLNEVEKYITIQEKFLSEKKIIEMDNLCLLGVNYVDLFENIKEQKYLNRAAEIYHEYILGQEEKKIIKTPMCGLYSKKLVTLVKDNTYMEELESNNKNLVQLGLDGGIYKILNDGSFFTNILGEMVMYKSLTNNALAVELIRN